MINIPHHITCNEKDNVVALTVDSDGNALGEDEAVGALEGGNLAELVELQVLGRHTLGGLSLNELDVEAVLLRDGQERGGTRVTLLGACQNLVSWKVCRSETVTERRTYRVTVKLSERHDCDV